MEYPRAIHSFADSTRFENASVSLSITRPIAPSPPLA